MHITSPLYSLCHKVWFTREAVSWIPKCRRPANKLTLCSLLMLISWFWLRWAASSPHGAAQSCTVHSHPVIWWVVLRGKVSGSYLVYLPEWVWKKYLIEKKKKIKEKNWQRKTEKKHIMHSDKAISPGFVCIHKEVCSLKEVIKMMHLKK